MKIGMPSVVISELVFWARKASGKDFTKDLDTSWIFPPSLKEIVSGDYAMLLLLVVFAVTRDEIGYFVTTVDSTM
jgi:hypothetical protein